MNGIGKNKMRRTVFTIHPDRGIEVSSDKNKHPSKESAVRFQAKAICVSSLRSGRHGVWSRFGTICQA